MNFSISSIPFLSKQKQASVPLKLPHTDPDAVRQLCDRLRHAFSAVPAYQSIVIVCVGTDRSTGDALGPLVGSSLQKSTQIPVYGTLDEPIHAVNLADRLQHIEQTYRKPFIVAIDACLGQLTSVGCIQADVGPVKPGAGVNKDLPPVGDYHVTGIVNVGGFMEYFVLQNTRLSLVFNMAEVISEAIRAAAEERITFIKASGSLE
jgi:putative sporulation protein YyaC